jgi:hypothetical protein
MADAPDFRERAEACRRNAERALRARDKAEWLRLRNDGVKLGDDHGALHTQKTRSAALEARRARADARATEVAPIIAELRASGVTSIYGIAKALNARQIPTATGRARWQATQVKRVLARLEGARPPTVEIGLRTLKAKARRDMLCAALVETAHVTGREAADALNARGIATLHGKPWNSVTVTAWRMRFGIENTNPAPKTHQRAR